MDVEADGAAVSEADAQVIQDEADAQTREDTRQAADAFVASADFEVPEAAPAVSSVDALAALDHIVKRAPVFSDHINLLRAFINGLPAGF